jgi:CheY-like chemotaxis protein
METLITYLFIHKSIYGTGESFVSKIMIVDDEGKIRYITRKMLESKGHEVIEAEGGKECLEILKSDKPDVILMDIMMPEMNGWKAVKEIKKDRSNEDIKICMLTVKSTSVDREKSMDAGAHWHISKPISAEDLLETVRWLLTEPFDN